MADLDDFFAKKDRKRTKAKKFATSDELAKKLEDTTKKSEPKTRDKTQLTSLQSTQSDGVEIESGEQLNAAPEEDEWREFEEEERKDYSGLKIGNLHVNDDDDYSGTDIDGGDLDGEDGDGDRGAWKKMAAEANANANATANANANATVNSTNSKKVEETDDGKKKGALASSSSGVYISPALRQQQQAFLPVRLKKDALPDINNEEYFPTLGAAKMEEIRKKKNEPAFEEVKQGARYQRSSDLPTNAPVSVGNRFNQLADS